MKTDKPKDDDIDGWKAFIMQRIFSQHIISPDPATASAQKQFFTQSVNMTIKLRGIAKLYEDTMTSLTVSPDYIKTSLSKNEPPQTWDDDGADRVASTHFILRKRVDKLAEQTRKAAFDDFNLGKALLDDLSAWRNFLANGKSDRMYRNKTLVGFIIVEFLKRYSQFPARSKLSRELKSIGITIKASTLQDCLDNYELRYLIRDNQIG